MGTSITYGIFGDLVWGLQAEFLQTLFGAYRPPVQVQIPVLGGSLRGSGGVLGAGVSDTPGPGGSWGPLGEVIRAEHKGGPFFRWVCPGFVSLRSERNKQKISKK
mgnify:FL=1